MRKAIIVGHSGQDGTYLYQHLLKKNYALIGLSSKSVISTQHDVPDPVDILNEEEVNRLTRDYRPDEIYYLAAVHNSSGDTRMEESELLKKSIEVNISGLVNFLEATRKQLHDTRLFYAASSHIFGNPTGLIQNEQTPLDPVCIYGITKCTGTNICRYYRNDHGIYASVGILYNHESPIRASGFVSKKIVEIATAIKKKKKDFLLLGKLDARIDWGYAPDYMDAAHRILQLIKADDFIISSGEQHTVKDFVEGVFNFLGLDWKKYVREDPSLITKQIKRNLCGDNTKLKLMTGWKPEVSFSGLIEIMVNAELKKDEYK